MQSGVPLWEKKERLFENVNDQEMVGDYVFRANRSLEHLHPQHQDNNEKWLIECVHSFGNLAMISQSFNSQQSDDPVTVKFARIADQAHNHALQSLKLYKMYLDAGENGACPFTRKNRSRCHQDACDRKTEHVRSLFPLNVNPHQKNGACPFTSLLFLRYCMWKNQHTTRDHGRKDKGHEPD